MDKNDLVRKAQKHQSDLILTLFEVVDERITSYLKDRLKLHDTLFTENNKLLSENKTLLSENNNLRKELLKRMGVVDNKY
ncbi:MAG: hypothetical protein QM504_01630 [Pseudomonadota bacterium]